MARCALWVVVVALCAISDAGPTTARTAITVWSANAPAPNAYGGAQYGGATPLSGAMITERREVDVGAGSEVRVVGVAATIDPTSVQLRDLTDPAVSVGEQRFVPGAGTPDDILARHVGDTVTVVTAKGEVTGVLRSSDPQALVLQVMRRDGYVQDIRLPAGTSVDKPSLMWRLASKKPGKHAIEVSYRAEGMTWTADYVAILDDAGKAMDFAAWATVKNATGTAFDAAEIALAGAAGAASGAAHGGTAPARFVVPTPVRLGNGESVQVELIPARKAIKTRSVVIFESVADLSASYQGVAAMDCNVLANGAGGTGHAEVSLELDVPGGLTLPDGRARLFRRKGDQLELVSEEQLRTAAGIARVWVAADTDIVGERRAISCSADERTRTIHEKIEIKVENKGKQATDVIVREYMFRWPVWKIDPADESPRGVRAAPQTQDYRVSLPAGAKKTVTYSVLYTW
jgi:hypothetical protein